MSSVSVSTRRACAFTVIELLVSIAIIFILITAVAVALKGARRAAGRAQTLSALRQIMIGYQAYSDQYNGLLLPGYIDASHIGTGDDNEIIARAKLRSGYVLTPEDSSSYVWRLAPYLNHDWKVFMADYRDANLVSRMVGEYNTGDAGGVYGPGTAPVGGTQLGIAGVPSFGLNSVYLGGDTVHADPNLNPYRTWPNINRDTVAALRVSDVRNPAHIIVFASAISTTQPDLGGADKLGYPELCPPFGYFNRDTQSALLPQWMIDTDTSSPTFGQPVFNGMGEAAGLPISRDGDDQWPVSHLDGSTGTESILRAAADMTRWSPFAAGAR